MGAKCQGIELLTVVMVPISEISLCLFIFVVILLSSTQLEVEV